LSHWQLCPSVDYFHASEPARITPPLAVTLIRESLSFARKSRFMLAADWFSAVIVQEI